MDDLSRYIAEELDRMHSDGAELAVRNVAVLHRNQDGMCGECSRELIVPWPCSTTREIAEAFKAMS